MCSLVFNLSIFIIIFSTLHISDSLILWSMCIKRDCTHLFRVITNLCDMFFFCLPSDGMIHTQRHFINLFFLNQFYTLIFRFPLFVTLFLSVPVSC